MKQTEIVNKNNCQVILFEDALQIDKSIFVQLHNDINWRKDNIQIFGKNIPIPRYHSWYADNQNLTYKYSSILMYPNSWTPILKKIKAKTEEIAKHKFNSALVNLYETGKDYAAWHSDDEKELGKNPIIASVSLGETRSFHLRHKKTNETIKINLTNGSILTMTGETQHLYKHQLAKTVKNVGPRINITFRNIIND